MALPLVTQGVAVGRNKPCPGLGCRNGLLVILGRVGRVALLACPAVKPGDEPPPLDTPAEPKTFAAANSKPCRHGNGTRWLGSYLSTSHCWTSQQCHPPLSAPLRFKENEPVPAPLIAPGRATLVTPHQTRRHRCRSLRSAAPEPVARS